MTGLARAEGSVGDGYVIQSAAASHTLMAVEQRVREIRAERMETLARVHQVSEWYCRFVRTLVDESGAYAFSDNVLSGP